MRVAIVGVGHVGMVTGAALAGAGHHVIGTDIDATTIEHLRAGRAPFAEPGLDAALGRALAAGTLRANTSVPDAVDGADVVFVCVGRPADDPDDGSLAAVEGAVREVVRAARDGVLLVVKSTVPPGTAQRVAAVARSERPDLDLLVASNPEFLREGQALDDARRPDRIVVGADDPRAFRLLRELYRAAIDGGSRLIETDPRSAELSKLASNAFLATKISFANALARVAERSGADVAEVVRIMGADPRIGGAFLGAGLGYGGSCLPKDVAALERLAARSGYDFGFLREAARINGEAVDAVARLVEDAVWTLEGTTVCLLGLAFKEETDDVRGSPALRLAQRLSQEGALVVGVDPRAGDAALAAMPGLRVVADPYEAAAGSACLVLATAWPAFLELDPARLKDAMVQPAVVDARGALDPAAFIGAGFHYARVGRPTSG